MHGNETGGLFSVRRAGRSFSLDFILVFDRKADVQNDFSVHLFFMEGSDADESISVTSNEFRGSQTKAV